MKDWVGQRAQRVDGNGGDDDYAAASLMYKS